MNAKILQVTRASCTKLPCSTIQVWAEAFQWLEAVAPLEGGGPHHHTDLTQKWGCTNYNDCKWKEFSVESMERMSGSEQFSLITRSKWSHLRQGLSFGNTLWLDPYIICFFEGLFVH